MHNEHTYNALYVIMVMVRVIQNLAYIYDYEVLSKK